jgi:hypothetical protein
MTLITEHRGVGYSLTDLGNGAWRWATHTSTLGHPSSVIESGEVSGTHDDAMRAAKAAIDRRLAAKSS